MLCYAMSLEIAACPRQSSRIRGARHRRTNSLMVVAYDGAKQFLGASRVVTLATWVTCFRNLRLLLVLLFSRLLDINPCLMAVFSKEME